MLFARQDAFVCGVRAARVQRLSEPLAVGEVQPAALVVEELEADVVSPALARQRHPYFRARTIDGRLGHELDRLAVAQPLLWHAGPGPRVEERPAQRRALPFVALDLDREVDDDPQRRELRLGAGGGGDRE